MPDRPWLCPENIGCGQKLAPSDLDIIRAALQEQGYSTGGVLDYALWRASAPGPSIVASIDRIVRFCRSLSLYAEAAVRHCANDIFVSGCLPQFMNVTIGVSKGDFIAGDHISLTTELFRVSNKLGLSVGKLHTFFDQQTTLTICLSGIDQERRQVLTDESGGVYVLGMLGGLKAHYLEQIGYHEIDGSSIERALLKDNSEICPLLDNFSIIAGDISGFGLLVTLECLLREQHAIASIDLGSVPVVHCLVEQIDVDALDGSHGYKLENVSYRGSEVLGRLTEINGPLVCLVGSHDEDQFTLTVAKTGLQPVSRIGEWTRKS